MSKCACRSNVAAGYAWCIVVDASRNRQSCESTPPLDMVKNVCTVVNICTSSFRSVAGCFPETLIWYSIEQVYEGIKCKVFFSISMDWILRCIWNYLFTNHRAEFNFGKQAKTVPAPIVWYCCIFVLKLLTRVVTNCPLEGPQTECAITTQLWLYRLAL